MIVYINILLLLNYIDNRLGSDGVANLSDSLSQHGQFIHSLSLENNVINDKCTAKFTQALMDGTKNLKYIYLASIIICFIIIIIR